MCRRSQRAWQSVNVHTIEPERLGLPFLSLFIYLFDDADESEHRKTQEEAKWSADIRQKLCAIVIDSLFNDLHDSNICSSPINYQFRWCIGIWQYSRSPFWWCNTAKFVNWASFDSKMGADSSQMSNKWPNCMVHSNGMRFCWTHFHWKNNTKHSKSSMVCATDGRMRIRILLSIIYNQIPHRCVVIAER